MKKPNVQELYDQTADILDNLADNINSLRTIANDAEIFGGVVQDTLTNPIRDEVVPAIQAVLPTIDSLLEPLADIMDTLMSSQPAPAMPAAVGVETPIGPGAPAPAPAANPAFDTPTLGESRMMRNKSRQSLKEVTRANWEKAHPETQMEEGKLDFRAIKESYDPNRMPRVFGDSKKTMREMYKSAVAESKNKSAPVRMQESSKKPANGQVSLEDWSYIANSTDIEIEKHFK